METPSRILRNLHLENVKNASTPLKIPASPFMKQLGYGTGVNVYRLDRPAAKSGQINSPWAVKRVSKHVRIDTEGYNARIEDEANILRKLQHPNIVGFRGLAKTNDGVTTLALECCKTSLGDILEERMTENLGPLPAKQIVKVTVDICRALDYLHTEAKLLHGDLKSYNVLVNGDFDICKLCDFGVSLPLDKDGVIDFNKYPDLEYVGTSIWSAPEVVDGSDVLDCKADMFSFGLIIYETIALTPPHTIAITNCDDDSIATDADTSAIDATTLSTDETAIVNDNSEMSVDSSEVENSVVVPEVGLCGTRPPLPSVVMLDDDYNRVVEVFYLCTNELAEDRPMAKVIWQSLENELPTEPPAAPMEIEDEPTSK